MTSDNENIGENNSEKNPENKPETPVAGWKSELPEELREMADRFESPADAVRAYWEAHSFVSKKVDDYTREDWQNYRKMHAGVFNCPEKPDDYNININDLEKGQKNVLEDEVVNYVKNLAFELGVNQEGAQKIYRRINSERLQYMENQEQAQAAHNREVMESLDKNWGAAWKEKLADVDVFLTQVAPNLLQKSSDECKKWAVNCGVFSNPESLMIMAGIGSAIRHEPASPGTNNIAPLDAKTRSHLMENDPEMTRAYFDSSHPRHAEVQAERKALFDARG